MGCEWPERTDSAGGGANFVAGRNGPAPQSSAHACVDVDSIVQCVPWDRVAWHAPGANQYGIGIHHAGYAKQTGSNWLDVYSTKMLDLSAWLAGELCMKFNIPVERSSIFVL